MSGRVYDLLKTLLVLPKKRLTFFGAADHQKMSAISGRHRVLFQAWMDSILTTYKARPELSKEGYKLKP